MKKQIIIYSLAAFGLILVGFGFGFVFGGANSIVNKPIPHNNENEIARSAEEDLNSSAASLALDQNVGAEEEVLEAVKITPSTKMVYEYYYLGDGKIESTEDVPPYFLLDLTEKDMKDRYVDWNILSFSPEEVVMRKNLDGKSNQYYIVGVHEGYVAVFYAAETNGTNLKEITDMPVSSFPDDEQERLYAGIHVSSDNELIKVLEDYGS